MDLETPNNQLNDSYTIAMRLLRIGVFGGCCGPVLWEEEFLQQDIISAQAHEQNTLAEA